eukprot:97488_1
MADFPTIKICLMGAGSQGKSALVLQFITGEFLTDYDPTIEDTYSKTITVNDQTALIEILDTAGQEVFWSMQDQWIRESEVFLLVFSITSRDGFRTTDLLRNKIFEQKPKDIPIVLVGTCADLSAERLVSRDQAQQKATRYNCEYMEVSSFTRDNLNELFDMIVPLYNTYKSGGDNLIHDELKQQQQSKPCLCCGNEEDDDFDETEDPLIHKISGNNHRIQFFKASELPPDAIPTPILSLKNFRIARHFYPTRFLWAGLHGLFVPIVVFLQTCIFITYSERTPTGLYPDDLPYGDSKQTLLWDYLGMVVGRKPGQDPECKKNKRWFLRQTTGQNLKRVVFTIVICAIFVVCCYNITFVNDDQVQVSLLESAGPFVLFWCVWFLLSIWIGYERKLKPHIPALSRLRSLALFFGAEFSHQSSVYKFIRAFESSRTNNRWKLNKPRTLLVIILGALYAMMPGITRLTFGDASEEGNKHSFFSQNGNYIVEIGALLVNFVLISTFIYCVEIQYKKQFDNIRTWMSDLTNLLDKPDDEHNAFKKQKDQTLIVIPSRGSAFSKDLFLSLTRRQNALGWLEIRSFLGVQSQILFGEQELPTLWMVLATCLLALFCFYRTFFYAGNPLESILFNGLAILTIIGLIALVRILITAYKFEGLQMMQEKLIAEQKFFMRCNRPYDDIVDSHAIGILEFNKSHEVTDIHDNPLHDVEQKTDTDVAENESGALEMARVTSKSKSQVVKLKFDDTYPEHKDSMDPDEDEPFLKKDKNVNFAEGDTLTVVKNKVTKMEDVDRYGANVSFVEDILVLIKKKDIYPRLFKLKLNSVLSKIVAVVVLLVIVTLFRLVVDEM